MYPLTLICFVRNKVRVAALAIMQDKRDCFVLLDRKQRRKYLSSRVRKKLGWSSSVYNTIKQLISFKSLVGDLERNESLDYINIYVCTEDWP